jgi:hypothetical protein
MHCEGCLADLEFQSPQTVSGLASRDELSALDYWQTMHAACRESMQRLREATMYAHAEGEAAAHATANPPAVVQRPAAISGPTVTPLQAPQPGQEPPQ